MSHAEETATMPFSQMQADFGTLKSVYQLKIEIQRKLRFGI